MAAESGSSQSQDVLQLISFLCNLNYQINRLDKPQEEWDDYIITKMEELIAILKSNRHIIPIDNDQNVSISKLMFLDQLIAKNQLKDDDELPSTQERRKRSERDFEGENNDLKLFSNDKKTLIASVEGLDKRNIFFSGMKIEDFSSMLDDSLNVDNDHNAAFNRETMDNFAQFLKYFRNEHDLDILQNLNSIQKFYTDIIAFSMNLLIHLFLLVNITLMILKHTYDSIGKKQKFAKFSEQAYLFVKHAQDMIITFFDNYVSSFIQSHNNIDNDMKIVDLEISFYRKSTELITFFHSNDDYLNYHFGDKKKCYFKSLFKYIKIIKTSDESKFKYLKHLFDLSKYLLIDLKTSFLY